MFGNLDERSVKVEKNRGAFRVDTPGTESCKRFGHCSRQIGPGPEPAWFCLMYKATCRIDDGEA